MASLIKKAWVYVPNEYTTKFTLTATFGDGQTEVFSYNKTDGSWAPAGAQSRRIAVIAPSSPDESRFIVRAFVDDPFVSLTASYGNATSTKTAESVNMTKMVFDKNFFNNRPFTASSGDLPNPYFIFDDEDLADIYFTNLTSELTLPTKKYNLGSWYGWGIYNETKPYSEMLTNPGGFRIMPLSWIFSWKLTGYPNISASASTSSHPDLNSAVEAPIVNNKLYMVPLYHYENPQFDIDTKDYRIDTTPVMYSVNVTAGEGGSVQSSATSVQAGDSVTIEAIPNMGSAFSQWSDGNKHIKRTITNVDADVTISAQFTILNTYTIVNSLSTNLPDNGGVKLLSAYGNWGDNQYIEETSLPFTFTNLAIQLLPGYDAKSVRLTYTPVEEGATLYSNNSSGFNDGTNGYILTRNNEFHVHDGLITALSDYAVGGATCYLSIYVELERISDVRVTVNTSSGGSVVQSSEVIPYGGSVTLMANANDGYFFNGYSYLRYGQPVGVDELAASFDNITEDLTVNASFIPTSNIIPNAATDYDGNSYDGLVLGDTVWLKQPLRSEHDSAGNGIQNTTYPNGSSDNVNEYGLLYDNLTTWNNESNTNPSRFQSIAPNDWHIPSVAEFIELVENNYGLGFLNFKSGTCTENYDYSTQPTSITYSYPGFGEWTCVRPSAYSTIPVGVYNSVSGSDKASVVCVYDGSPETLLAQLAGTVPATHEVNLSANAGGLIAGGDGETAVLNGGKLQIEAIPDNNHLFDKWSDNNTDNPRILRNITTDLTLTASFKNPEYFYLEANESNSTVSIKKTGNEYTEIQYSTDGVNFNTWMPSNGIYPAVTLANIGDRIYIRIYSQNYNDIFLHNNLQFILTGSVTPGGNFGTMFISNGVLAQYSGDKMVSFANCTALTHAPNMNFNFGNVYLRDLHNVFDGCTFNMSDDGDTFNFEIPVSYPIDTYYYTVPDTYEGYTPITLHNDYELAQFMGNTTGFTPPV